MDYIVLYYNTMIEYDRTNEFILNKKTLNELHQILKKKILNKSIFKIPVSYTGGFNTDFDGDEFTPYVPLTHFSALYLSETNTPYSNIFVNNPIIIQNYSSIMDEVD